MTIILFVSIPMFLKIESSDSIKISSSDSASFLIIILKFGLVFKRSKTKLLNATCPLEKW